MMCNVVSINALIPDMEEDISSFSHSFWRHLIPNHSNHADWRFSACNSAVILAAKCL